VNAPSARVTEGVPINNTLSLGRPRPATPGIRGAHRLLCTPGQLLLELIKPIMIKPDQISGSREIAQGSFGTIYSAMYNKRRVAVKRINKVRNENQFFDAAARQGHGGSRGLAIRTSDSSLRRQSLLWPARQSCHKRVLDQADISVLSQDRSKPLAIKMREAYLVRSTRGWHVVLFAHVQPLSPVLTRAVETQTKQELNIMNNLSHPNVVQLIGVSAQFTEKNPQSFYFGYAIYSVIFVIKSSSAWIRASRVAKFCTQFTLSYACLQDCTGAL